jgi:quercetin dioxygenase-like cupin family protein
LELGAFEEVAGNIGVGVKEEEPSQSVKERLLAETSTPQPKGREMYSVFANEGEWRQAGEGILLKVLSFNPDSGVATSLVRMSPGARLYRHRHKVAEEFFILEGDCTVEGARLHPGDYHRAEAGSIHESTYTDEGTLFLLIAPLEYEPLVAH